jgi:Tfp pilus assembly protein PilP
MLPSSGSLLARSIGWVTLAVCLAAPAAGFAQATPKLPTELPVPKAVPKPEVPEIARPLQPGPAAQAAQSTAPAPAPASPAGASAERDPFVPLVTKAPEGENRPSLSGLRLVGVIWDPVRRDQIRALVETTDGLGYYVRMNEEKFGGKVVGIERDRVRFAVREQDPSGQSRVRTVELKLN